MKFLVKVIDEQPGGWMEEHCRSYEADTQWDAIEAAMADGFFGKVMAAHRLAKARSRRWEAARWKRGRDE